MRKLVMALLSSLLITGCQPVADNQIEQAEKPLNILFIIADDQRFDALGAYGNKEIYTPNLDKLAREGMRFTHVYNQGGWNGAICMASRRMLNTGRNLFRTGMDSIHPPKKWPYWGEVLRKNGYETFITGKWHLPMDVLEASFDSGKAIFKGGMSWRKDGGQHRPKVQDYDGKTFHKYTSEIHSSTTFANAAIDFIEARAQSPDKPFMGYVSFLAPHDPRDAPPDWHERYPHDDMKLWPNFSSETPINPDILTIRDEKLEAYPRSEADTRRTISDYYAIISHMDHEIGRILDALEIAGLAENTLVIYTADHGLAVGSHGLLGKQNLYDHSIRVPYILRGPGVPAGTVKKGNFYIHASMATSLEMAGIRVPDSIDANSIVPLIKSNVETVHETISSTYLVNRIRSIQDDRYKLIAYPEMDRIQLFDMQKDPFEMNDLSGRPELSGQIAALAGEMERWQREIDSPQPVAEMTSLSKGRE